MAYVDGPGGFEAIKSEVKKVELKQSTAEAEQANIQQPAENKPKVKWWQKVRDGVGTAFGEWKFGGR